MRKTAGSGSAKKECEFRALLAGGIASELLLLSGGGFPICYSRHRGIRGGGGYWVRIFYKGGWYEEGNQGLDDIKII